MSTTYSISLADLADHRALYEFVERTIESALKNPATSKTDLVAILPSARYEDRIGAVLAHPNADNEVYVATAKAIVKDRLNISGSLAMEFISDLRIDMDTAVQMARSMWRCEEAAIACVQRPDFNPEALASLSGQLDSPTGIKAVLATGKAPEAYVKRLSGDRRDSYRVLVAQSASASAEILATLSTDAAKTVRVAVARNANTEPDRLRIMLKDYDEATAKAAARNLKRRGEPLEVESDALDSSDPLFAFFAGHAEDKTLLVDAARDADTAPELLMEYAENNEDKKVQTAALLNPSLPREFYVRQIADMKSGDHRVAGRARGLFFGALENPGMPSDVAALALTDGLVYSGEGVKHLIARIDVMGPELQNMALVRCSYSSHALAALAKRTDLTHETYRTIWSRCGTMVERVLAANPACPTDILESLSQSSNERIAKKAQETLAAKILAEAGA